MEREQGKSREHIPTLALGLIMAPGITIVTDLDLKTAPGVARARDLGLRRDNLMRARSTDAPLTLCLVTAPGITRAAVTDINLVMAPGVARVRSTDLDLVISPGVARPILTNMRIGLIAIVPGVAGVD